MFAFMKTHMRLLPQIFLEAVEYGARDTMVVVVLLQSTKMISELMPIHHGKLTLTRASIKEEHKLNVFEWTGFQCCVQERIKKEGYVAYWM